MWSTEDLQLLGVFHGHRRSVWCVRFSPVDQVLLTTSADCTMKLWSLTDLNCLKVKKEKYIVHICRFYYNLVLILIADLWRARILRLKGRILVAWYAANYIRWRWSFKIVEYQNIRMYIYFRPTRESCLGPCG